MKRKALIIEDSPEDAELAKVALEELDLEIKMAQTGDDGLNEAQAIRPDLIVLDLWLPDMDGFEICSRIKANANTSKAIVIIMSVKDRMEDITRAFNVGADDYVIKPLMPKLLIRKVELYLKL